MRPKNFCVEVDAVDNFFPKMIAKIRPLWNAMVDILSRRFGRKWKPGNPLPNARKAKLHPAKFEKYSMHPAHPTQATQPKWKAWEQVGYDVTSEAGRRAAAQEVISQLRKSLPHAPATLGKVTPHGLRLDVRIKIRGPNGKEGTLFTAWQQDKGSKVFRLITNWLEVHR